MPNNRRARTWMGIAAVVIVLVALSLLLFRCARNDAADKPTGGKGTRIERSDDESSSADTDTGVPDVIDTPANPRTSTTGSSNSQNGGGGSGSQQQGGGSGGGGSGTKPGVVPPYTYAMYLADTKRNVVTRSDGLNAAVNDALANIANSDSAGLLGMYALDEGASPGDATSLISGYPAFVDSELSSTVNVYSVGSATVYFGFAVVEWQDGGVLSKHTIGVPLRLINGVWCLSTIDLNTPGLTFVQSIQI